MKPVIKIGIAIIVVAIFGIVANQFGGDVADETPIVSVDVVDTTVEKVDDIPIVDENLDCMGTAKCFAGIVSEVIDGDNVSLVIYMKYSGREKVQKYSSRLFKILQFDIKNNKLEKKDKPKIDSIKLLY